MSTYSLPGQPTSTWVQLNCAASPVWLLVTSGTSDCQVKIHKRERNTSGENHPFILLYLLDISLTPRTLSFASLSMFTWQKHTHTRGSIDIIPCRVIYFLFLFQPLFFCIFFWHHTLSDSTYQISQVPIINIKKKRIFFVINRVEEMKTKTSNKKLLISTRIYGGYPYILC